MESFFDRQLSVSVDQLGTLSKVWNFLSNVYEILPKSTRPSSFRHFPSPILGHSDNFLQILYWFNIHRQILSLLAQLMSASVKSCRIFSYQGTFCHLVSRLDTFRQRMSDFRDNLSDYREIRLDRIFYFLSFVKLLFIICYTSIISLYIPNDTTFLKKIFCRRSNVVIPTAGQA